MAPQADLADADVDDEASTPLITAHETTPERRVFTEADNPDGWISTDLTVAVEP